MASTVFHRSPFLFLAQQIVQRPDGRRVVPAFLASRAQTMMLDPRLATALRTNNLSTETFTYAELAEIAAAGLADVDPAKERGGAFAEMAHAAADQHKRTFVLLPSTFCNMGCAYCGQKHRRGVMTGQHRDAVSRRIHAAISRQATTEVEIRWFGGEPLMAYDVLKDMSAGIIAAADESGVKYTANITTNGALLDERKFAALVQECRVSTFHITIDGPADIHDRHRPLKSGQRNFERLMEFLTVAVRQPPYKNVKFVLRTNVDVDNSDHIDRYLDEMADRGFADLPNVMFSLVAVHPWGNDVTHLQVRAQDFADREAHWLARMFELGLGTVMVPSATKPLACGAVTRAAEVLDADGGIFSCSEQPLVPGLHESSVLASISELGPDTVRPAGAFDSWAGRVSTGKVPCSTCWMLPVCGGHCPKAWDDGNPPCPSMKLNMTARLTLAARARGWEPIDDPGDQIPVPTAPQAAVLPRARTGPTPG